MARGAPKGTRSFAVPRKPVVTIKIELGVMTTISAYEKGAQIAKSIREEEHDARVRSISVTN